LVALSSGPQAAIATLTAASNMANNSDGERFFTALTSDRFAAQSKQSSYHRDFMLN